MNAQSNKNIKTYGWLIFFPFWGLPLLLCSIALIEVKFKLSYFLPLTVIHIITILVQCIAVLIFLSGAYPILKSNIESLVVRILAAGVYYLFAGLFIVFFGFFFGWKFLLAIGWYT
jgi:hypothetical protein